MIASVGQDFLSWLLRDMAGGLGSLYGVKLSDVLLSPEEYSPATAKLMANISTSVVLPLAAVVLVVLFFLELTRISMRTDGDGELFVKVAFFTLVKFGLIKVMLDSSAAIISGIYSALSSVAKQANVKTENTHSLDAGTFASFIENVDKLGYLEQAMLCLLIFIAWLVNRLAVLISLALVVVRFVKLYIYGAWGPVPIAFFAHQDTRQFGINFLRNYAGVVLQAFVLVLAFAIYQAITSGWATRALAKIGDMSGAEAALNVSTTFIFLGLVLIMTVLGSGRIANELVGA